MAIIRVAEMAEARRARMDGELHREYSRTWLVVTDAAGDSPGTALFAAGIPLPLASYVTDTWIDLSALAEGPEVSQPDPEVPTLFHVTVNYSTRSVDPSLVNQIGQGTDPSGNTQQAGGLGGGPLDLPVSVEWGWMSERQLMTESYDDPPKPIVNSAGKPFDPAPEDDAQIMTLTVVTNHQRFPIQTAFAYQNAVNEDEFQTFQAGQAKVVEYSARLAFAKNVRYWVVTKRFAFRLPDWDLELLDHGTTSIDDSAGSGNVQEIANVDRAGNPVDVRLDGAGHVLAAGAANVYLRFRRRPRMSFAALNIPDLTGM